MVDVRVHSAWKSDGEQTKLFVLTAPPASSDITSCYGPMSVPSECVSYASGEWEQRLGADREAVATLGGSVIDLAPLFCVDGACPAFSAGVPVKSDLVHITVPHGEHVAAEFAEWIAGESARS